MLSTAFACDSGSPVTISTSPTPQTSGATEATAADLTFCVQETNRYRALASKPALTESAALEAFAAEGARIDGTAKIAHAHFSSAPGVASAENELLAQPLVQFGTVHEAIRQALSAFYAEGPGGGHYENLTGPYTQTGCGVYTALGLITVVQDFR